METIPVGILRMLNHKAWLGPLVRAELVEVGSRVSLQAVVMYVALIYSTSGFFEDRM